MTSIIQLMSEGCDYGVAKASGRSTDNFTKKDHLYLKALQCLHHEDLACHSCLHCLTVGSQGPDVSGGSTLLCRDNRGILAYLFTLTLIKDLILWILNSVCKGKKNLDMLGLKCQAESHMEISQLFCRPEM